MKLTIIMNIFTFWFVELDFDRCTAHSVPVAVVSDRISWNRLHGNRGFIFIFIQTLVVTSSTIAIHVSILFQFLFVQRKKPQTFFKETLRFLEKKRASVFFSIHILILAFLLWAYPMRNFWFKFNLNAIDGVPPQLTSFKRLLHASGKGHYKRKRYLI